MKYILAFSLLFVATFTIAQAPAVPQASIVVSSLSQLTDYTGSLLQANWTDELRGGRFNLVDATGLTVDNGIVFTSAKAGKYWKRDLTQSQAINAQWFGLSSSTTDAQPVLQAMINAGLKKIYFPKATYSFSSPIKPKDSLEIFGEKGTVFAAASGFVGTMLFNVDTIVSFTLRDVELNINYKTRFALQSTVSSKEIRLSRVTVSKTKFHGMFLRGRKIFLEYCTFDSCGVKDSAIYNNAGGIFTSGVVNLNVDHCIFSNIHQNGVYSLGNDSGYTSVTNCDAYNCGGAGLSVRTQAGRVIGNHCFRNLRGIYLDNMIEAVPPLQPTRAKNVVCMGNVVEDNHGILDDVLISGGNGLEFIGNIITSNDSSAYGLKINRCNSCDISNNVITGGTSGVMALFDTMNNTIIANNHLNGHGGTGIFLYQSSGIVPVMNVAQIQNNQFYGNLTVGIYFRPEAFYNDIILQGNLYKDVVNYNIYLQGTGTNVINRDDPLLRKAVSADYTMDPGDRYIAISGTANLDSIYLPLTTSLPAGTEIVVTDETGTINNTTRPLTFLTQGGELLNGASSQIVTDPYIFLTFISNGSGKWIYTAVAKPTRYATNNANVNITPYQKYVSITALLSSKTFTLPAASSVVGGSELIIADESGSLSPTVKITIAAAGSDLINGNATEDIVTPYGFRRLISDGVSKWFFDGSIVRVNQTQTLTNKSLSGSSNTFTNIPLTTAVTGILPKANGGTGTATPGLTAGSNITITGTWPNNTISSSAGGSSLGYSLPFATTASQSPADATTYYPGPNSATVITTAGSNKIYIPKTGTITHVSFFAAVVTVLGTTETASLYVRVNNTTDYLVSSAITLSASTQEFHNNSLTIPVSGDYADYIEFKLVCPTWVTNPTGVRMTITAQVE